MLEEALQNPLIGMILSWNMRGLNDPLKQAEVYNPLASSGVQVAGLMEMRSVGCFFTWTTKNQLDGRIWRRLDRAIINEKWLNTDGGSFAEALPPIISDHSPIIIRIQRTKSSGRRVFRFDNFWCKHPLFLEIVKEGWRKEVKGSKMYQIVNKLKQVKEGLKEFNRREYAEISDQVRNCKQQVEDLQRSVGPLKFRFLRRREGHGIPFKRSYVEGREFLQAKILD